MNETMSLASKRTSTSILRDHGATNRDRATQENKNKVRFSVSVTKRIKDVLDGVEQDGNVAGYEEFICMLNTTAMSDEMFQDLIGQAKDCIQLLQPKFLRLIETILSFNWLDRPQGIRNEYKAFLVELLVTHNKYTRFAITKLVTNWIPDDMQREKWILGSPNEHMFEMLVNVHEIVAKIIEFIPMASTILLKSIEVLFPYHKKSPHIIAGYLHNIFWFLEYQPIFTEDVFRLILQKLLVLDVNASREEIEMMDEENEEEMFELEVDTKSEIIMRHPVAESLDICMLKVLQFIDKEFRSQPESNSPEKYFRMLVNAFDTIILPAHNPHHVQFFMFYVCSFKPGYLEYFLSYLWAKVSNHNVPSVIRQSAVCYLSSVLARGKFIPTAVLRNYLREFCSWSHQYIAQCDSGRFNTSLKAHGVFYSVCQAIFYVIAFRSRDLTTDNENILFLQSLQLSSLVTSTLNPLRVCLPVIATTFAGVTRAHQLTYCHTILERNARRKLATVYSTDVQTPDECLDTFFPFDPYLLKKSLACIEPLYLAYQASEAEEKSTPGQEDTNVLKHRRRNDTLNDEDDFIPDKKKRFSEMAKECRDLNFFGSSPGFHI